MQVKRESSYLILHSEVIRRLWLETWSNNLEPRLTATRVRSCPARSEPLRSVRNAETGFLKAKPNKPYNYVGRSTSGLAKEKE